MAVVNRDVVKRDMPLPHMPDNSCVQQKKQLSKRFALIGLYI